MDKKYNGISPDVLKITAMVTMFSDHVSYGIVRYLMVGADASMYKRLDILRQVMSGIGRLAFPIFVYQLVQGFIYTKDRLKYAAGLLFFAVLAEAPFDYCFYGKLFMKHQNTLFELLAGLLMLCVMEYVNEKFFKGDFAVKALFSDIFIMLAFLFPAQYLRLDYGGKGIILIASIYILYNKRDLMVVICPILFIISFYPISRMIGATHTDAVNAALSEVPAMLAFILINYDNGIRKIKGRRKYIFYAFYPAHLLLIYAIRRMIF